MKTHVLRGSKKEIVESLARINGEVHEAIVFIEDTVSITEQTSHETDIFGEMRPFMVDVNEPNDSREALYIRAEGE